MPLLENRAGGSTQCKVKASSAAAHKMGAGAGAGVYKESAHDDSLQSPGRTAYDGRTGYPGQWWSTGDV